MVDPVVPPTTHKHLRSMVFRTTRLLRMRATGSFLKYAAAYNTHHAVRHVCALCVILSPRYHRLSASANRKARCSAAEEQRYVRYTRARRHDQWYRVRLNCPSQSNLDSPVFTDTVCTYRRKWSPGSSAAREQRGRASQGRPFLNTNTTTRYEGHHVLSGGRGSAQKHRRRVPSIGDTRRSAICIHAKPKIPVATEITEDDRNDKTEWLSYETSTLDMQVTTNMQNGRRCIHYDIIVYVTCSWSDKFVSAKFLLGAMFGPKPLGEKTPSSITPLTLPIATPLTLGR